MEDDPVCRETTADQLSDHGFVVRSLADAMSLADGLAVSGEADIILLDWDLPGVSGIELLVELRQCGVNLPVVQYYAGVMAWRPERYDADGTAARSKGSEALELRGMLYWASRIFGGRVDIVP